MVCWTKHLCGFYFSIFVFFVICTRICSHNEWQEIELVMILAIQHYRSRSCWQADLMMRFRAKESFPCMPRRMYDYMRASSLFAAVDNMMIMALTLLQTFDAYTLKRHLNETSKIPQVPNIWQIDINLRTGYFDF